jgi:hypothetical protein
VRPWVQSPAPKREKKKTRKRKEKSQLGDFIPKTILGRKLSL